MVDGEGESESLAYEEMAWADLGYLPVNQSKDDKTNHSAAGHTVQEGNRQ